MRARDRQADDAGAHRQLVRVGGSIEDQRELRGGRNRSASPNARPSHSTGRRRGSSRAWSGRG
jgi:hypothetical protein